MDLTTATQMLNLFERLEDMEMASNENSQRREKYISDPSSTKNFTTVIPSALGKPEETMQSETQVAQHRQQLMELLCRLLAAGSMKNDEIKNMIYNRGKTHILRGHYNKTETAPTKSQLPKEELETDKRIVMPPPPMIVITERTQMNERNVLLILEMMESADLYHRTEASTALKKLTAQKVVETESLCSLIGKAALLRLQNEDDVVAAAACAVLANLAHKQRNIQTLRTIGVLKPILGCLESYHMPTLEHACTALRHFAQDDDAAKDLFQLDALPLLLVLVRSANENIRANAKAAYDGILLNGGDQAGTTSTQLIATNAWEIVFKDWKQQDNKHTSVGEIKTRPNSAVGSQSGRSKDKVVRVAAKRGKRGGR